MKRIKVLVGVAGSGKSTWSHSFVETRPNWIILSSDAIREELQTDDNIYVFATLRSRLEALLDEGYDVIVDATNVSRKNRRSYVAVAKKHEATIEAVVFATPLEECLRRNANRERVVPEAAIRRMVARWELPTVKEGFNNVIIVKTNINKKEKKQIEEKFANFGSQHSKYHSMELAAHCDMCYDLALDKGYYDNNILAAAQWHDLGKVFTVSEDEEGYWHYYNHANFSSHYALAYSFVDYQAATLINYHMLVWDKAAYKKMKTFLDDYQWNCLMKLHECDEEAHQ